LDQNLKTKKRKLKHIYIEKERNLLSSSSGNGIGPFLSAVKRPSHGGGSGGAASSFFLILYYKNKRINYN
jgi:hypothetical protein